MLSVCIPLYNYSVKDLVLALLDQGKHLSEGFEIIVIDDASPQPFQEEWEFLSKLPQVQLVRLSKNLGRSKVRNRFVEVANGEALLFLDCDVLPVREDFLDSYLEAYKNGAEVVCGGIAYQDEPPSSDCTFRWKYGRVRESRSLELRQENPFQSFMTGNFLVSKDCLESIGFDERLSGYGHEDTLFGFALRKNGLSITHIDNPVYHLGLEPDSVFFQKTEQAIDALRKIHSLQILEEKELSEIRLLKAYQSLRRFEGLLKLAYPLVKFLMDKGIRNLRLFDLLKLSYLAKVGLD